MEASTSRNHTDGLRSCSRTSLQEAAEQSEVFILLDLPPDVVAIVIGRVMQKHATFADRASAQSTIRTLASTSTTLLQTVLQSAAGLQTFTVHRDFIPCMSCLLFSAQVKAAVASRAALQRRPLCRRSLLASTLNVRMSACQHSPSTRLLRLASLPATSVVLTHLHLHACRYCRLLLCMSHGR
jgi:hypothetical protein